MNNQVIPDKSQKERAEGSPSLQLNSYSRIFEQNVNIREPMSLEMIESLFTNMNDIYSTLGTSFDSLTKMVVALYRKAMLDKDSQRCKECEAAKENQELLRKEITGLKKDNQALKLKNQELQLIMKSNEFQRTEGSQLSDRKPDGTISTQKHETLDDDLLHSKSKKTPFLSVEKKVLDTPNNGKSSPNALKRSSKDLAKMLLEGGAGDVNSGKNSRADSEHSKKNSPVKSEKKSTPPKNKKSSPADTSKAANSNAFANLDGFVFRSKQDTNISNQKGFKKRKPNSYPAKEDISPQKIVEPEIISRKNSFHSSGENSAKSISIANLLETFSKDKVSKGKSSDSENSRDLREIKMASSKKSSQSSDSKKKKKKRNKSSDLGEVTPGAKAIIQGSDHVPRLIEFDDFKENSNKSIGSSIPGGRKYKTLNNTFLISQQSTAQTNIDHDKLFGSTSAPVTQKNNTSSQKPDLLGKGENKEIQKGSTGNKTGNSVLDKSPKLAEFFKPFSKDSESKSNVVRATKLTRNERSALPGFDCGQCKKFYDAIGEGAQIDSKSYCNNCSRHRDYSAIRGTPEIYHHDLTLDSQP